MNRLFPLSVISSTLVAALIWQEANVADKDAFDITALTFAATLLTLAVLEHWFLVLPLPFEALWNWGLRSRTPREVSRPAAHPGDLDAPAPVLPEELSKTEVGSMKSVAVGITSTGCISY